MSCTGRGLQGIMISGCPETFQSFQESQQGVQQVGEQEEQQGGHQFSGDQHQKIREVQEGDVFVVSTGVGHFIYNNGNNRLIVVSVIDISNDANQLDFQPRVCRETLNKHRITRTYTYDQSTN